VKKDSATRNCKYPPIYAIRNLQSAIIKNGDKET